MSQENLESKVVIPGNVITGVPYRPGDKVIKIKDKLYSIVYGIKSVEGKKITIIPYREIYKPKKGDIVIGVVVGYGNSGWFIDVGSYTKAFLHVSEVVKGKFDSRIIELSDHLKIGDIIIAKVIEVSRLGYFQITIKDKGLGKINNAFFLKVDPVKLRRIIGKRGAMINLIKDHIKGEIILGRNGVIAYKGDYDSFEKLKYIINIIVKKTFAAGLTNKISEILNKGE